MSPRPVSTRKHELGPYLVTFAYGDDDRTAEYRLRYDVFVDECHFESADRCPDRQERDELDAASCALVLQDRVTGEIAACQRLVLPDCLSADRLTNFEREYRGRADAFDIDLDALPRQVWAEASRTTVARRFRFGTTGNGMPGTAALTYATVALALALGRSTLFSLSEPITARLMRRHHFRMEVVGPEVEFHGTRVPFLMDVAAMEHGLGQFGDRTALDRLVLAARRFVEHRFGPGHGPARAA